jgi:hypothetical protein
LPFESTAAIVSFFSPSADRTAKMASLKRLASTLVGGQKDEAIAKGLVNNLFTQAYVASHSWPAYSTYATAPLKLGQVSPAFKFWLTDFLGDLAERDRTINAVSVLRHFEIIFKKA